VVDFTEAQIGVQPVGGLGGGGQRPSQPQSPSAAGAALNLFSQLMPTGQQLQQRRDAENERIKAGVLQNFQQEQLALAEAVDMGTISSKEARMRMRANYSQAISNHELLADDLHTAHSNILGTSGLGKVAAEGTEQEKAWFAAQKEATLVGFVTPYMTEDQAFDATNAYMRIKQRSALFEAQTKAINAQRAELGLSTDAIRHGTAQLTQENTALNLQLTRQKVHAQHYAGETADDYMGVLVSKADSLRALVEAGQMEAPEAAQILRDDYFEATRTIRGTGRGAGTEFINNLLAPMDQLVGDTMGYLDGSLDADTYASLTENNVARQTYMASGDDNLSFVLGLSRMAGQGGALALESPMQSAVVSYLQRNMQEGGKSSDLFPEISSDGTVNREEAEGAKQYLGILKNSMFRINQGTATGDVEDLVNEVNTNLNNVFRSFEQHEAVIENPKQVREVLDFVKDPSFGAYIEAAGASLDGQALAGARRVFNNQYDEVVRPLVQERWAKAVTATSPVGHRTGGLLAEPVGDRSTELFRPEFTGKGIEFVLTDDSQRSNPRVVSELRSLNAEVASVVNDLIIASAHLSGTTDYEKIYNERYASIFAGATQEGE
jgi:hypothetical protein